MSVVHISQQSLHSEREALKRKIGEKKKEKHVQVNLVLKSTNGQNFESEMESIDLKCV